MCLPTGRCIVIERNCFKNMLNYFNIVVYRAFSELKTEGSRTYAGYLWWIVEPLMSLSVYYVAFTYIFKSAIENFALFLFIGIVVYRFFAGTLTRGAVSIQSNNGLMQLVYLHKSIFPLSVVMVNFVKFFITFLLVLVVTWIAGITPGWAYLGLPILVAVELLFIIGGSMICAAITPFFPDFQIVLGTILHLFIFLSGVFFDISKLPEKIQIFVRLNPIAVIIEHCRLIILKNQFPNLLQLLPTIGISIFLFFIGWLIIHKANRYFPKIS